MTNISTIQYLLLQHIYCISTAYLLHNNCISIGFPGPAHPEAGVRWVAGLLSPLHHGYRGLLLAVYGDNRARLVTR